jgi:imidazolonepropionase-like amidohydrolase
MREYAKELYYPSMTALTGRHPSSVQVAVAAAVTLMKYERLKSGTANVGVCFGTQSTVGTVAAGKRLILLEANLLTKIANSSRIAGVMVNGRWLSKADIDALAAGQ